MEKNNTLILNSKTDIKLFDIATEKFYIIDTGHTRYIVQDSIGNLWWTMHGQLSFLSASKITQRIFTPIRMFPEVKLDVYIYPNVTKNEVYVLSKGLGKVYTFNTKEKTYTSTPTPFTNPKTTPAWVQYINLLTVDKKIYYYNRNAKEMQVFFDFHSQKEIPLAMTDHIAPADKKGEYYIMTTLGDIILAKKNKVLKTWTFHDKFDDFPKGRVSSFLIDRNDMLWFATTSGIYKIPFIPNYFKTINYKGQQFNASTRKLIEHNNDEILISSYAGLYLFNKKTKKNKLIDITKGNVYEIAKDKKYNRY